MRDYSGIERYYNVNDEYTYSMASISGTYDITFRWTIPSYYSPYHGFKDVDGSLTINLNNLQVGLENGTMTLGTPSVTGILPNGIHAYASTDSDARTFLIDSSFVSYRYDFNSGIQFDASLGVYAEQSINCSYTVSIPFTLIWRVPNTDDLVLGRQQLEKLLVTNADFDVAHDSITEYGTYYDLHTIVNSIGTVQSNQKKQLDATKDQTQKQGNFFKSVLEWFTNFPNMMLSIVVPSDGTFSDFFAELREFINSKMGILGYPFEIFAKLVDLINNSGDTIITLPSFSIMGYTVWDNISYNLSDGLAEFSAMLSAIRIGMSVLIISAFLLYCQKKFDEVLKGGVAE